jgi:hypothetical protein
MLPDSVLPLAKMKMVLGHAALFPLSSSLRVALAWRASSVIGWGASAGAATGTATAMGEVRAREAKRERMAMDFMLSVVVAMDSA